jgi:hypothetical protein
LLIVAGAENFTLANPHFHTDCTVHRARSCRRVINVSTKRVKWNASFFILFAPRHFCAAETTGGHHTNAFSTHPHRCRNSVFHCTTECDAALQLLGDVFCNQVRVEFRSLNFVDKNLHFFVRNLLQFFFELGNFFAASSDHDSRP